MLNENGENIYGILVEQEGIVDKLEEL